MNSFDQQLRALERDRREDPERDDAIAALYERIGRRFHGKTLAQWIEELQKSQEDEPAEEALRQLAAIGPPALRALPALRDAVTRGHQPRLMRPAVAALIAIAGRRIPAIAALLDDPAPRASALAAQALAALPGPEAEAALLAGLTRDNAQEAVAKVLAFRHIPAAIPALDALLQHGNPSLQYWFYRALDAMDHPRALDAIEKCIDHKDPAISARAFARFAKLEDRARASPPLLRALASTDPEMRYLAAEHLAADPRPEAEDPLIKALDDPEPHVRRYAARALGQLASPAARDALRRANDNEPFVRRAIIEARQESEMRGPP